MKKLIKQLLSRLDIEITRKRSDVLEPDDAAILNQVKNFTMTSQERLLAVIDATRYLSRRKVCGDFVECGVWRGGCSMAAALALLQEKDDSRRIYLFDTFTGMTEPTDRDISIDGVFAKDLFPHEQKKWCAADLEDVKCNMFATGYPRDLIDFIIGPVEETITSSSQPKEIALLRLDTDWYESTHHELIHLFPRLSKGGVLIIDDYGHWKGARKAVDEYLESQGLHYLLQRTDYSGRMMIKTD